MLIKMNFSILMICLMLVRPVVADDKTCFPQAQVEADLQQLYDTLKVSHFDLFAHVSQADYDRWYTHIRQQITTCMDPVQTRLLLQKLVAYGRVAHAKIELPVQTYIEHRNRGGLIFPLAVRSDGTRLWVSQNLSDHPGLKAGDELLAINGVPVKALFSRLRHYLSADTDYMLGGFLEFYLELLLFFEWGELNEYSLKVGQQDQAVIQVKAVNKEQLEKRQAELPASLVLGWERQARMLPDGVAYLRPGPFFNTESSAADPWDNRAFSAFIEQSFETFKARKPSALLIDLRDNPGGDNSFSDLMLRWIADQPFSFASTFQVKVSEAFRQSNDARLQAQSDQGVDKNSVSYRYQQAYQKRANGEVFDFDIPLVQPGPQRLNTRVFMLVNRHSYSNAVTTAAMAQDYGFATILGEETSDLAVTYGAMEHFTLSHTGIQVGFPKALIIRPSGDRTVRGVVPDHLIKTPVVESVDDPVLKAALRHIHSEKNES